MTTTIHPIRVFCAVASVGVLVTTVALSALTQRGADGFKQGYCTSLCGSASNSVPKVLDEGCLCTNGGAIVAHKVNWLDYLWSDGQIK